MPAPSPLPEVLLGNLDADQVPLPLAADGVLRYVWQSAFGPILIEVHDDAAFVNGRRVTTIDEMRTQGDAEARLP